MPDCAADVVVCEGQRLKEGQTRGEECLWGEESDTRSFILLSFEEIIGGYLCYDMTERYNVE